MSEALQAASTEFLVRYGADIFPSLFTEAKGTIVRDSAGREYLDFTSGQMCATIGHNHPAIVAAVNRAGQKAFHLFSGMIPEVVVELAQTLARDWLPGDLKKTIFVNTGSESNEVALRMAKMYTGGYEILALGGSWHGVTGGSSAVSFASDRKVLRRADARRLRHSRAQRLPPLYRRRDRGGGGARLPRYRLEDVRHAVDRARRRDHRRADHQRRRRAGAAEIVHAGAAQGGGRPRHAADLR